MLLDLIVIYTDGQLYSQAEFGTGTGPVFLDAVSCFTSSSQLLECPSSPLLTVSNLCDHSKDAGVGCERKCWMSYS